MTSITLDGLNEEEFRRSIEARLRHDLAGAAVDRLRALIAPYAAPGGILPERFLTVTADDLNLYGWEGLADALRRLDRPGRPVTALGITFGWPGEDAPGPDADGKLTPCLETCYYNDDAFPFSQSGREDLLDGYSYHGCTWGDDCEARETTLSLGGIDDLHGALAGLEARLLASEEPDEEEIRAGSLGACLLSVLLFQAVGARVARDGLPRPLCVMSGSNGVYPYFDAPVVGLPEEARKAGEAADEVGSTPDRGVPGPRYSSLLVTGIPRARKRAVLVLEESEDEMAVRIANLRSLNHRVDPVEATPPEPEAPVITPVANGPLMAKKPLGQGWDFREMLGPREDGPASGLPASDQDEPRGDGPSGAGPAPDPLPEPAIGPGPVSDSGLRGDTAADADTDQDRLPALEGRPPVADLSALDAILQVPRRRFPRQLPVEPGFSLIEPTVQDRLHSLLAPHVGAEQADGPITESRTAPAPFDTESGTGLEWSAPLENTDESSLGMDDAVVRPGLWARLRAWLGWRK